jgi:alanine racemase
MDEMMVDVGDDQVEIGSEVVLLGMQATSDGHVESIDAVDLATWAGTIPYEITTAISARVPRTYVGGSAHHAQAASSEPR